MAILSNVNGKFAVDSTGAIQFSGSAGTSGYILRSNGNAAPTWVDVSTVIPALPYLPIGGGVLTGPTATASGISFTVGGTLTGTTASFTRLDINASNTKLKGDLLGNADAAYDIGASGANRPRNLYLSNSINAGDITTTGVGNFGGSVLLDGLASNGYRIYKIKLRAPYTGGWGSITPGTVIGGLQQTNFRTDNGQSNIAAAVDFVLQNNTYGTGETSISFKCGGVNGVDSTERMRIESGGNIKVNFNQSGSVGNLYFQDVTNGASMFYIQPAVYKGSAPYNTNYINAANNSNIGFIAGGSEKMRITSGGNVGIGTTTPVSKFEVNGSIKATGVTSNIGAAAGLSLSYDSGINYINTWASTPLITSTYNYQAFHISGSEKMRIHTNGNVGIGTTSPQERLHVVGLEGSVPLSSYYGSLVVDNNGEAAMSIIGNSYSSIYFGDAATNFAGAIVYNHSLNAMEFRTNGNLEKMRITSAGHILAGTGGVNPSSTVPGFGIVNNAGLCMLIQATSDTSTNTVNQFINPNGVVGTIQTNGSSTAYNTSSDYRLKEDLQDFNGIEKVSKIPVYDFKWKVDKSRSYGVMAHELQEVLPDAVGGEKDGEERQMVDYSKIVPLLVKAIQELEARIKELENK